MDGPCPEGVESEEAEFAVLVVIEEELRRGNAWGASAYARAAGASDQLAKTVYRLWRAGAVAPESLPDVVSIAWMNVRHPLPALGERKWVELFRAAVNVDGTPNHVRGSGSASGSPPLPGPRLDEVPTEPFECWRGADIRTRGRGMSWSISRECARRFAVGWARVQRDAALYRALVSPGAVLAVHEDEGEQEVVVDPAMLEAIDVVEQIPAGSVAREPSPGGSVLPPSVFDKPST